jgi:hypothetical protein
MNKNVKKIAGLSCMLFFNLHFIILKKRPEVTDKQYERDKISFGSTYVPERMDTFEIFEKVDEHLLSSNSIKR